MDEIGIKIVDFPSNLVNRSENRHRVANQPHRVQRKPRAQRPNLDAGNIRSRNRSVQVSVCGAYHYWFVSVPV
jgi:hypothetical protein